MTDIHIKKTGNQINIILLPLKLHVKLNSYNATSDKRFCSTPGA